LALLLFFILIVACINYINLTTAQASRRAKEVGIKKVIGATKKSLFSQFLTESVLTSLLAMIVAFLLTNLSLPFLETATQSKYNLFETDKIWLVLGGITLVAVLLTGIYPSLLLTRFQPLKIIKGINLLGDKNIFFRKFLVVFQFTFTIFLLIGTLVIFRQLQFIQTKNPGYDRQDVFAIEVPWNAPIQSKENFASRFTEQLIHENSIAEVTAAKQNMVDNQNSTSGSLDWEGRSPNWNPSTSLFIVNQNFQQFFGLKMAEGRWFRNGSQAEEQNMVLNEMAIRTFKIKKPYIGQRFEINDRKGQIIGIVKDFHFRSMKEQIPPLVMLVNSKWMSYFYVKTKPHQTAQALAGAKKIWSQLVPDQPMKYDFLDESFENLHHREQMQLQLFMAFSGVVLLIACLGLLGLTTFAAETRTKEIGIRKVLGATVSQIVTLLSKDFLTLVTISFVIASPIAWYAMNQWLQDFAYRINISWWIFALAGSAALLIALLTISFQAIKAALANPVSSLRNE
jgi:ABC-type antimicrobial peptide transport system permease subunit